MGGDFLRRWRAGSKVLACGSLLLAWVIATGMATQTALAETAAPVATRVADNEKAQGGPGAAQASRTPKPESETVLRQPEAQKPAPEAQKSAPEVQKPAPEAAVQMPEPRKSSPAAKDLPLSLIHI